MNDRMTWPNVATALLLFCFLAGLRIREPEWRWSLVLDALGYLALAWAMNMRVGFL